MDEKSNDHSLNIRYTIDSTYSILFDFIIIMNKNVLSYVKQAVVISTNDMKKIEDSRSEF